MPVTPYALAAHALLLFALFLQWSTLGRRALPRLALPLWALPALASLSFGYASAPLAASALLGPLALAGLCLAYRRGPWFRGHRLVIAVLIGLVATALATHRLPGFSPLLLWPELQLGPRSAPYTWRQGLDSLAVAVLLNGLLLPAPAKDQTGAPSWRAALPALAAIPLVLGMGTLAGLVAFEPHAAPVLAGLLLTNLFYTCVMEEAFFRGFVQAELRRHWSARAGGRWWALALAAALFGLAHLGGGTLYAALVTLASLAYGWAFERTGRYEAAVLVHWLLNASHMLLFTYPGLAR